jgi:putative PIN family toxin of toxin-antitoxin system
MRLVLDTNVLISAILFGGKPRQVLEMVITGQHRLLISSAILDELVEVLVRDKFRFPAENTERIRQEIVDMADLIAPRRRLRVVIRDPADDRVIECAAAGKADCIVSGDKDLLDLKQYRGMPIMSPAEFLAL